MGIFSESQKVNYTRMKEGWRTNYFVLNTIKAAFYPVTITSLKKNEHTCKNLKSC